MSQVSNKKQMAEIENRGGEEERVLVTEVSAQSAIKGGIKKGIVYVVPESCADCSVCAAGRGCQQNNLFRLFAGKKRTFPLETRGTHRYKKGDILILSFSPHALPLAACCLYLLPLLSLLLFALGGEWLHLRAELIPVFAFSGMALAYYGIRRFNGGAFWKSVMRPSVRPFAPYQKNP